MARTKVLVPEVWVASLLTVHVGFCPSQACATVIIPGICDVFVTGASVVSDVELICFDGVIVTDPMVEESTLEELNVDEPRDDDPVSVPVPFSVSVPVPEPET